MAVKGGGYRGPEGFLFELTGGRLCLDLANTVDNRPTAEPVERLESYGDLVSWGEQAGAISRDEGRRLRRAAVRAPEEARAALRQACRVREAIFEVFSAVAAGHPPREEPLALLNVSLQGAMRHLSIVATPGGFAWGWGDAEPLGRVVWPVMRSAAELLIEGETGRVRECAAQNCAWLFLDTSRNRSRRWCDMSVCGNRNKARRHYQRKRLES